MSQAVSVSPDRIYDTIGSFQRAAALKAAIELDLFTAIGEGHQTAEAIGERCKIAVRGARILADYLVINAFLTKNQGTYTLGIEAAAFLDRRSPNYIGEQVSFIQSGHVWAQFGDLTQRVRRGGAPPSADSALAPDHEMWVRFARAMQPIMAGPANLVAQQVLRSLASPFPRQLKILDVAAGHGMYGIACAQQNPNVRVVSQDWPAVLEVARQHALKFNVADRIDFLPGSAFDVPFGSGFDVVIIANFMHHFDIPTNVTMLKKAHAALNPGGLAVTVEFAPNEDRVTPAGQAAFAIFMLAITPAGDTHTVGEIGAMYVEAGFQNIRAADLPLSALRCITGTSSQQGAGAAALRMGP